MNRSKNSKGTPSKETGMKNNNSDNDVDYKNTNGSRNSNSTPSNKTTNKSDNNSGK